MINQITKSIFLLIITFSLYFGLSGQQAPKGSLVLVGGALKSDNADVYNTFINLGGGKEKIHIAIIPAASIVPAQSGNSTKKMFQQYGVPGDHIKVFPLAVADDPSTKDCDEQKWSQNSFDKKLAREILQYNAVFFVGGDQLRYRKILVDENGNDSPMLKSIRKIYQTGGVVGGTSAGTAIMSNPMILGGTPVETIIHGAEYQETPKNKGPEKKVWLTHGFGLFPHGIVDQHFLKRGRAARLIPAMFLFKDKINRSLGFGVDEDTALIYSQNTIQIAGRSGILVIDIANANVTQTPHGPKAENIILHYLEPGDTYNPITGEFHINPKRKKIKPGKEYYKNYPLDTNILRTGGFKEILTGGLVDNKQDASEGLCFTLDKTGSGTGMRMVFKKTPRTEGYYGKIRGSESFSALNVRLDFFPVSVRIKNI